MKAIIHGCKQQNPSDQRELFRLLAPRMMTTARRYTDCREAAEDVLQEAFVQVFKNFATFDETKGPLEPWVRRIVIHAALRLWRSRHRRIDTAPETDQPFAGPTVSAEADLQMDAEQIMALIEKLPEGYRVVFNLCAVDGYSHAETADMLGITESTSRSQLARARKLLQEAILAQNSLLFV